MENSDEKFISRVYLIGSFFSVLFTSFLLRSFLILLEFNFDLTEKESSFAGVLFMGSIFFGLYFFYKFYLFLEKVSPTTKNILYSMFLEFRSYSPLQKILAVSGFLSLLGSMTWLLDILRNVLEYLFF